MALISKENFNHGAVIHKIVESSEYKSINCMKYKGKKIDSAYMVNDRGLFCKYAEKPNGAGEYVFNFSEAVLDSILSASDWCEKVFVALECLEDQRVCLIEFSQLQSLVQQRIVSSKKTEDYLVLYVKVERSFEVGTKAGNGTRSGEISGLRVNKNAFPKAIFK